MRLVLGTMNFGPQLNLEQSKEMVQKFLLKGYKEVDTAYVYNGGDTENYLGKILPNESDYEIATKIHPRITGRLDRETIIFEITESLKRMKRSSVDLLYFHFPDSRTPIESALETITELKEKGMINEFGLSNYPAWEVVNIWHLCDKQGFLKPTVYQGMYNALCRDVEVELFPSLKYLGIRFYAFNPLAGGLLTGKHVNYDDNPSAGRFERLQSYRDRYWKKSYFDAINIIRKSIESEPFNMTEASFRWLTHHSKLKDSSENGIIIGASSLSQLNHNIEALNKDSLPEHILQAFDLAWECAASECPRYFKYI